MRNKNIVASSINNKTNEEFLEHKTKKKWVNGSGYNCFMLYPRAIDTTWGNHENWDWKYFKETSDENIEVIKLNAVCWLDVRGRFKISHLTPGILYEIAYEVKLTNAASGWELPIKVKLSLPDGKLLERQLSLLEKPKGKWVELNVGSFRAEEGEQGEVRFDMYEHGGHWKTGLIIKGVLIRPKP